MLGMSSSRSRKTSRKSGCIDDQAKCLTIKLRFLGIILVLCRILLGKAPKVPWLYWISLWVVLIGKLRLLLARARLKLLPRVWLIRQILVLLHAWLHQLIACKCWILWILGILLDSRVQTLWIGLLGSLRHLHICITASFQTSSMIGKETENEDPQR